MENNLDELREKLLEMSNNKEEFIEVNILIFKAFDDIIFEMKSYLTQKIDDALDSYDDVQEIISNSAGKYWDKNIK